MSNAVARKTWHVIVGFWVGGLVTQSVGIAGIALYQTVVYGHFAYVHLFRLSLGERLFCAAVPAVLAVLLWRKRRRPYVSVGMLVCALAEWLLTAPTPWAK
jgi:hypothetical protein